MATRKRTGKKTSTGRTRTAASGAKRATGGAKATRRGTRSRPQGLTLGSATPSFTVDDLEQSIAWYSDVLGFVVKDRWEHEGKLMGVELRAGRVTFMLGEDDWRKGRDRKKGEGFRLYCETTEDVDRLAEQIKARGGTVTEEPRDEPWGVRDFSLEDPDGFKITISRQR